MRLAELAAESDHGGWRAPVEQQAKAIELLPARVDELLPRWMEWGERHLQLIGFDRNNLGADRGPEGATTYELYRTAQAWLELGEHTRALGANRRLLAQLPGFLPALDLAIEIAVAQGRDRDIVEAVASRVQRGGRTPRLDTVLAAVDPSALTPKSRLALIEADPERMGRLLVAQDLLTRGETQLALGSLEAIAADAWTEDARVLAAQLRLERGDYAQAADLILPTAMWTEKEGAYGNAERRGQFWRQQVLPLVARNYWRSIDETGRPTDHFWRWDLLLFQSVFLLDILLRALRLRHKLPFKSLLVTFLPLLQKPDDMARVRWATFKVKRLEPLHKSCLTLLENSPTRITLKNAKTK
jgi:hypothetical protein